MLDSRRDCRYRRVAHCSIGVGLRKVAFHDMPGTPEEVPGIPLTLIHPSDPWPLPGHPEAMKMSCRRDYFHTSAWKVNSANFALTEFSEVDLKGFSEVRCRIA
jgi:hypothetical protein